MTLISFAGAVLFLLTQTPKPVVDSGDEATPAGERKTSDVANAADTDGDHHEDAKAKLFDYKMNQKVRAAPAAAEEEATKQTIEMATGPNVARPAGFAMKIPDAAYRSK